MATVKQDGLYAADGKLLASDAEVKRAGYDIDVLISASDAEVKRAEAAIRRQQAMPVSRQVNYEDNGDVLWA